MSRPGRTLSRQPGDVNDPERSAKEETLSVTIFVSDGYAVFRRDVGTRFLGSRHPGIC